MRRFARSAIAVTTLAAGAMLALAGTAAATQPDPGDDRATAHEGNTTGKDCEKLFPGTTEIAKSDLTTSVDDSGTYLDITAVASGVDVAGVIVKGGPAYNLYAAGDLGDLPWLDLHSPLVPSGKPAQISHWFACGGKDVGSSTKPPSSSSTPPSSSTAPPSSSTTNPPVTTTTTTKAAVTPAGNDDDLAATGFNGGWLVLLGAALLVGGGALLLALRLRGAKR